MAETFELDEFVRAIRAEIADESGGDLSETRRVSRFTEFFISSLADFGIIDDADTCYLDKAASRGRAICNGWHLDPVEGRLDLFATIFLDSQNPVYIQKQDIEKSDKASGSRL